MQTFKLLGLAFIALLMCVNFTACSSDDEDEAYYENGVVRLVTPGTLRELLGANTLITSLKIIGPINGDDVFLLRRMASSSDFYNDDVEYYKRKVMNGKYHDYPELEFFFYKRIYTYC